MKKIIGIITIFVCCIFLSGCKGGVVQTKCSGTSNQSDYKITSNYVITSRKGIVDKVELEQVIESNTSSLLDNYREILARQYNSYNNLYGGYKYNLYLEGNKLTLNLIINYDKVNKEKFITDNVSFKEFVNDKNEFTLDGAKKMYEASGMKCN